ncbi:MAG: hypothetical protein HY084_02210 [Gemmatimonadetes bacterium]|nr:hypothetical protein [Gemmatimonadota bacterium]
MFRTLAILHVALLATSAGAQVISVDEGSFALVRDGERVGREDFSIRSAPSAGGRMYVAQGTVVLGAHRLAPGLNADTSGFPERYEIEVRDDRQVTETYSAQTARDHYTSRAQREDGESAREFRLPPGTVAAEDDVIHQLWFIVRRGPGATVPVLVPRRGVIDTARVELVGRERLTIDVRGFDAQHLRVRRVKEGVVDDVWVDQAGRLLKVVEPSRRLVAVREEGPR